MGHANAVSMGVEAQAQRTRGPWRLERALGAAVALIGAGFAPHPATVYLLLYLAIGSVLDDGAVPLLYAVFLGIVSFGMWMVAPLVVAKIFVVALAGIRAFLAFRRSAVLPTVDVIAICVVALLSRTVPALSLSLLTLVAGVFAASRLSAWRRVPLLPFAAIAAVIAVLA